MRDCQGKRGGRGGEPRVRRLRVTRQSQRARERVILG